MLLEAVAAALVGLAGLWLVLQPLLAPPRQSAPMPESLDPEETPRGIALAALKEIDFDRETGKLSESDYEFLKAKYTKVALEALRAESPGLPADNLEAIIATRVRTIRSAAGSTQVRCASCGLRPEPDAVFCSTCGSRLAPASVAAPLAGPTQAPLPAPQ
jgi:hypothetical protein